MNPIYILGKQFITYPIYGILVIYLAITWGSLWLSIILLTLTVRLLMMPVTSAGNNVSKHMTDIQPKLQEIQEKYKDDQEKLSSETMKLMKEWWMAPLKWCLGLVIQIPIFIALYRIIINIAHDGGKLAMDNVYSFLQPLMHNVWAIQTNFLWLDLLSKWWTANIVLAILCGWLMFAQFSIMKMTQGDKAKTTAPKLPGAADMPNMSWMMWSMNYVMAAAMAYFVYTMQSGVGMYIFTTTLFGILQLCRQYRVLLQVKRNSLFSK